MNPGFWLVIFDGSAEHPPMWWRVIQLGPRRWAVDESYDEGRSWICNCVLPSLLAGRRFVKDWIDFQSE